MTEIILDTDIGSDCDDMMAISYLIWAEKAQKIKLNAVTVSHATRYAYKALSALFSAFKAEVPLCGQIKTGLEEFGDNYCYAIAEKFSSSEDAYEAPDAVKVLRKALVDTSGKAVICGIGPATNIARLVQSGADEISLLTGQALLREKCDKIVLMAGEFIDNVNGIRTPEWNVKCDIQATKIITELSDTQIVMLPYEVGADMITGDLLTKKYKDTHPLTHAFLTFNKEAKGRHSWDPATVLYAALGCGDFFCESKPGKISIGCDGETYFMPGDCGKHRVLSLKYLTGETEADAKERVAGYIDRCVTELILQTEAQ